MRVLEARDGPGVKSEMHSYPDLAAVFLTPANAKFTLGDGQTVDMDLQARESDFVEAQDHTVENTGTYELHAVLVELK